MALSWLICSTNIYRVYATCPSLPGSTGRRREDNNLFLKQTQTRWGRDCNKPRNAGQNDREASLKDSGLPEDDGVSWEGSRKAAWRRGLSRRRIDRKQAEERKWRLSWPQGAVLGSLGTCKNRAMDPIFLQALEHWLALKRHQKLYFRISRGKARQPTFW